MFEPLNFSCEQIERFYQAARHDLKIAANSQESDVIFTFCYNGLIKLAIAICAKHGLRVKSRQGHHVELIRKLAENFNNNEIEAIGNEMRQKRNRDLYEGGILISEKQAKEYLKWVRDIFSLADKDFK